MADIIIKINIFSINHWYLCCWVCVCNVCHLENPSGNEVCILISLSCTLPLIALTFGKIPAVCAYVTHTIINNNNNNTNENIKKQIQCCSDVSKIQRKQFNKNTNNYSPVFSVLFLFFFSFWVNCIFYTQKPNLSAGFTLI